MFLKCIVSISLFPLIFSYDKYIAKIILIIYMYVTGIGTLCHPLWLSPLWWFCTPCLMYVCLWFVIWLKVNELCSLNYEAYISSGQVSLCPNRVAFVQCVILWNGNQLAQFHFQVIILCCIPSSPCVVNGFFWPHQFPSQMVDDLQWYLSPSIFNGSKRDGIL